MLFGAPPVASSTNHQAIVRELLEIRKYRLPIGQETDLHRDLLRVLEQLLPGAEVLPEQILESAADRIDFYLPESRVGIECKVKGEVDAIMRQLSRYAASPKISHLVLVTSHLRLMPVFGRLTELNHKPFTAIALGGQLL